MSYYFNIISDFITFTTILFLCMTASYFPKEFLCDPEISQTMFCCLYISSFCFFATVFSKILLVNSGDIEINPCPRKSSPIKFCHWNLNGLAAHDFTKVPSIEAFTSTHNFDILCLSEIFLDSSIDLNDENINIDG